MAHCLTAQSQYVKQYRLTDRQGLWHSFEVISTGKATDDIIWISFIISSGSWQMRLWRASVLGMSCQAMLAYQESIHSKPDIDGLHHRCNWLMKYMVDGNPCLPNFIGLYSFVRDEIQCYKCHIRNFCFQYRSVGLALISQGTCIQYWNMFNIIFCSSQQFCQVNNIVSRNSIMKWTLPKSGINIDTTMSRVVVSGSWNTKERKRELKRGLLQGLLATACSNTAQI